MKKYLRLVSLLFSLHATAQLSNNKPYIVNDSSVSYAYKAVFDSNKKEEIIQKISSQFSQAKENEGDLVWNLDGSYEIVVDDNNITINFGKSIDNQGLYEKVKLLGQDLSNIINQPTSNLATVSQSTSKNRLVTNKLYVINDKVNTYSYRGVFTLNKRLNIKKSIERFFGEPKLVNDNFIWSSEDYDITLKNEQIEFFLIKNKHKDLYYNKFIDVEKDVTAIIVNPGPKNTLITTKNYVLNDNPNSYTFKAVFQSQRSEKIKKIISRELGNPNDGLVDLIWNENGSYEIILSDSELNISFGKSSDNDNVYQQIKELGKTIIEILN